MGSDDFVETHQRSDEIADAVLSAIHDAGFVIVPRGKWTLGDTVTKPKGSSWSGRIVGFYSTRLTPVGHCVESAHHPGSVQIYPETALVETEKETEK